MTINSKHLILLVFLLASVLQARIIEDFESFDLNDVDFVSIHPDVLVTPSVSLFSVQYGSSLRLDRDIPYESNYENSTGVSSFWTKSAEVGINLAEIDFTGHKYFTFRYRDLANFPAMDQMGAEVITISLYDGDERWIHEYPGVVASQDEWQNNEWKQAVVRLESYPPEAVGAAQIYIVDGEVQYNNVSPGFTVPLYQSQDPGYAGNGVFNKGSIKKMYISFGAATAISGDFLIDDIKVINDFSRQSIWFWEGYTTYVGETTNRLVCRFAGEMDSNTVNASTVLFRENAAPGNYVLSYDQADREVTIVNNNAVVKDIPYEAIFTTGIYFQTDHRAALLDENASWPNNFYAFLSNFSLKNTITNSLMFKDTISLGGATPGAVYDPSIGFGLRLAAGSLSTDTELTLARSKGAGTDLQNNNLLSVLRAYAVMPSLSSSYPVSVHLDYSDLLPLNDDVIVYLMDDDGEYINAGATTDPAEGTADFDTYEISTVILASSRAPVLEKKILELISVSRPVFDPIQRESGTSFTFSIGGGVSEYEMQVYDDNGLEVYWESGSIEGETYSWDGLDRNNTTVKEGLYIVHFRVKGGRDVTASELFNWYENSGQSADIKIPVVIRYE